MKTISLLVLATTGGCFCGSFGGAGDSFFVRRGSETLTTCAHGGFVMNLATGPIEGVFSSPTDGGQVFEEGATGARVTTYMPRPDGSVMTPELGDEPWQPLDYTISQRDHANIPCNDLPTRSWWGVPAMHVPVDTAFAIPNPDAPGGEPCGRGPFTGTPSCNIELHLCANGHAAVVQEYRAFDGGFTIEFGDVSGSWITDSGTLTAFTGRYTTDGILATTDLFGSATPDHWTRIPPDPTKVVVGCR